MFNNATRRGLLGGASAIAVAGCTTTGPAGAPSDALGDSDGVGVAARIRAGEITTLEATEAAIARAERIQPQINFMATPAFDQARAIAAANPQGPLGGVPTLIKDLIPTRGIRTMFGSRAYRNFVPEAQPPYMDALLAGGLVPIGKSTTPEFGYTATTEPLVTGVTRNPWNTEHSSGGSSGGSAAAVAAGVVPVADASDGGGSIRIPASICGLVGLKPSRRRPQRFSAREPQVEISVVGCLSHTVRDTAAWLALAERHGAEQQQEYEPVGLVSGPATRRLRIGVQIADPTGRDPDPIVRTAIEEAAELCRSLGHEVREVQVPVNGADFAQAFTLYWAAGAAEVQAEIERNAPGVPIDQLLEPLSLALNQIARAAPEGALERAIATLQQAETQFAEFMTTMDVYLTPVLARPPARIGEFAPTNPEAFQRIGEYVAYTPLQNAAGAPAISLPLFWTPDGLPVGSHFSAAKGQERTLLELAYELEQARPWRERRPPVWAG
ncbi:MAG: amidase [Hyphomonadaceae bacterium]